MQSKEGGALLDLPPNTHTSRYRYVSAESIYGMLSSVPINDLMDSSDHRTSKAFLLIMLLIALVI